MNFKVGDKVKRINRPLFEMEIGDIGTINSISNVDSAKLKEYEGWHDFENLKLVEDKKLQDYEIY